MKRILYPAIAAIPELLARPADDAADVSALVAQVFEAVRAHGDTALLDYTRRFDHPEASALEVAPATILAAESQLSPELRAAIATARDNIARFHEAQREAEIRVETMPGVACWRRSLPIEKVGLYIPGGTAPLFSTVLMLAVPAALAGCREVVLCTPPGRDGSIHPAILYAAKLCGVHRVFALGGSQAIAALATGTATVPKVDKILGPGNRFVTAAKLMAFSRGTAIDLPAGPSEVLVIADSSANPAFVAADLLSQAEHGPDSQVVLVTWDETLPDRVEAALEAQLATLPRAEITRQALNHARIVVVRDAAEAMAVSNAYAPEHLILAVAEPETLAHNVNQAGSVFLGHFSPESVGDYASGTNHTLPTAGYARAYAGVSLDTFVRKVTFQQLTQTGLRALGPVVETMARAEQLDAHALAVTVRLTEL